MTYRQRHRYREQGMPLLPLRLLQVLRQMRALLLLKLRQM
jgi:hypothetical protein